MKPARFIGLAVAMSVSATLSFAQADPAQIVKKRQETMKSLSPYMRMIFELRKDGTGDLSMIAAKAREASDVFKTIPSLFPVGTDRAAVQETRAPPEIWSKSAELTLTWPSLSPKRPNLPISPQAETARKRERSQPS